MRAAGVLLALLGVSTPGLAGAANLLFLDAEPGAVPDSDRRRRVDDAGADFTAERYAGNRISIEVRERPPGGGIWTLFFAPPAGETLAPGVYENAGDVSGTGRPAFQVSGDVARCPAGDARFVVHELMLDPNDGLIAFSADFAFPCLVEGGASVTGVIRIGAGDGTCATSADGTACDPRDACANAAACAGGRCVVTDAVACAAEHEQCEDAALCDPTSGACRAPGLAEQGTACDDGDACNGFEACDAGVCTPIVPSPATCDDADDCTDDFCDPDVGCRHVAVAGRCGEPGEAASMLFLVDEPAPGSGGLRQELMLRGGELEVDVATSGSDDYVVFLIHGEPVGPFWRSLYIGPPAGSRLAVGTYENTRWAYDDSDRPWLDLGCAGPGRFEVLEVAHDGLGTVTSLALRFAQHCDDGRRLWGAFNWRVGTATCRAQPDGTSCEDHNACTATASCRDGVCVGSTSRVCEPADACSVGSYCQPLVGACMPGASVADGTTCDDADPCTAAGVCREGACREQTAIVSCACLDVADGDTCWTLEGTGVVRATADGTRGGRDVHCTASCQRPEDALYVTSPDGTYRAPGGRASCPRGVEVAMPDEVGHWTARRDGTMVLVPDNLDALADAAAECSGTTLKKLKTWLRPSRDGGTAVGHTIVRQRERAELPITLRSTVFFNGTSDPAGSVTAPSRTKPPRACTDLLELRCRAQ